MDRVAAMGQLPALVLLHDLGFKCTVHAMDWASLWGHLIVVQFLHTHRREGATHGAMDWAAKHGHFKVVKFLHLHRREGCTTSAMTEAAKAGHVNIVKFLHTHRTEGGLGHMLHGAVVAFLTRHRPLEPCSPAAMDEAARQGNLAMVRFLHSRRSEGCTTQALGAAANGHGHVVEFLMDNLPRHLVRQDLALAAAAATGELQMVVKFSPYVGSTACCDGVVAAAKHNRKDVLAWFVRERRDVVMLAHRTLFLKGHANAAKLTKLLEGPNHVLSNKVYLTP